MLRYTIPSLKYGTHGCEFTGSLKLIVMRNQNVIQYSITIDTEEEWDWDAGWPVRDHSLNNISVTPEFQKLIRKHGARSTWFTNWSVLENAKTRDIMLRVAEDESVELGMHIHPWLTPPLKMDGKAGGSRESYLENLDKQSIHAKLDAVWDTFDSNGLSPVSFRGGRYSSGADVQKFLRQKGFIADASVVPYTDWEDDGSPDYSHRRIFPERTPPVEPNEKALWEVPVTLGYTRPNFTRWSKVLRTFSKSPLRHLRCVGIFERTGVVKRVWLNFEDTNAQDMLQLIDVLVKLEVPCICFTVHSSSLYVGGNPYSKTAEDVKRIWDTANTVLENVARRPDFEPAKIAEIAQTLEAQHESNRD